MSRFNGSLIVALALSAILIAALPAQAPASGAHDGGHGAAVKAEDAKSGGHDHRGGKEHREHETETQGGGDIGPGGGIGPGEGIAQSTQKKLFTIEMQINGNALVKGMNSLQLVVLDPGGNAVEGAEVTLTPWMTDMGHGVFTVPVVEELGGGRYRVSKINAMMLGNWELRVSVKKGALEDSAVFAFPGMKAMAEDGFIRYQSPGGYNVVLGSKNPLPELEHVVIHEGGKTIKLFRLAVKDTAIEVHPGTFFEGWGFNGSIPGPTIRVTEGDTIRIILSNETDADHTLHIHGQKKPVIMDGVPYLGQAPVKKGESYTYEFTVQTTGTSWYHCHVDSNHHVDMGMYGAFIVEPKEEKLAFDREYIMILDEFPTGHVHVHDSTGTPEMPKMEGHEEHGVVTVHPGEPVHEEPAKKPKKRSWYPETYNPYEAVHDAFTINGRAFPFTQPIDVMEGERVRIRIINVGVEPHYIHTHSHKFLLTHRDGLPVREQVMLDTVAVGPGQRADILLIADNPGVWPMHCHRLNHVANDNIYPGGMLTFIRYID